MSMPRSTRADSAARPAIHHRPSCRARDGGDVSPAERIRTVKRVRVPPGHPPFAGFRLSTLGLSCRQPPPRLKCLRRLATPYRVEELPLQCSARFVLALLGVPCFDRLGVPCFAHALVDIGDGDVRRIDPGMARIGVERGGRRDEETLL